MKFGTRIEDVEIWHQWFAWRPVRTISRQWVWLEWVERCKYLASHIPVKAPFSIFGCWCFRSVG